MMTYKLWLEPDREFPRFKRLAYRKTEVPIADILLRGVHPWKSENRVVHLVYKTLSILNSDELILPELKELNYCSELKDYSDGICYPQSNRFERTLNGISDNIFFVDRLRYPELLSIAQKKLKDDWSHKIAYTLLGRIHHDFNSIRDFLKKKDKRMKLSSYNDIKKYDLGKLLSLDDFEGEDSIIISEGLPTINFRSEKFIELTTDEQGHLRLIPSINHFQMRYGAESRDYYSPGILYNCARKGTQIRMHPTLDRNAAERQKAQKIAESWKTGGGRYCFWTDIEAIDKMLSGDQWDILFPNLDYSEKERENTSSAYIVEQSVPRFTIGKYIRSSASGNDIKRILRQHDVSMTGRKEELIEKLARLAASLYNGRVRELDNHFSKNRLIKVEDTGNRNPSKFPLLEDCDLKNMLLAMYIIKHLRGNTILEASHCNNTFDLVSLARSLINGEVVADGSFVSVNGTKPV